MKRFIKPDWTNSNLNVSATLAEFLGAPNRNATLPVLQSELAKGYKNVVFICFDGMGIYPLQRNLPPSDFLRQNIKQTLVSTFPSTTTNATTSLLQNKLPLEHGWFGWSMYFAQMGRNIDIFLNTDSFSGENVEIADSPLCAPDYYFDHAKSDYQISTVFPAYVKAVHAERNHVFSGMREFFDIIKSICGRFGKQFVYAYCPEPDSTMHEFGVSSAQARQVIESISANMRRLAESFDDTLFVVTADHGQIDIEGYVDLYSDETLNDMLEIYPYLEGRAVAFKVKKGRKKQFAVYFTAHYGDDFRLYKTSELLKRNFFGDVGDKGALLGDFIAAGTYTHKQALTTPRTPKLKGHHTGLTEEMEVPLILIHS